jgi:hypothetical protein
MHTVCPLWVIRDRVEANSKSGHVRYAPIATKFCILPR